MRNFFKNLLLFMLIGFFVLNILKGIQLPSNPMYLLSTLLIIAIGMLMASPILNFLTIKENFITNWLMMFLITVGLLYLLQTFMVDFRIEVYEFPGLDVGSVVINSFVMEPLVTIGVGALSLSFLSALFSLLEKN